MMTDKNSALVIARYNEDLEWISGVPDNYRIIVYNKGPLIESVSALERADCIIERRNVGRESETYLHHLVTQGDSGMEWTVFCQGDPFEHSPDFLNLLRTADRWARVQCLSLRWLEDAQVPPDFLIESETRDWIGDCRVRKELFSLHTLAPLKFSDPGMQANCNAYLEVHGLERGGNVIGHFLELAGHLHLASKAAASEFGSFSYGAIFAVNSRSLALLPKDVILKLIELNVSGHPMYGYICERLWLHFFGEKFGKLTQ